MTRDVSVGDRVKLIDMPEWLVHDLPAVEQAEMRACIGQVFVVREIDPHGYLWVGFGVTSDHADAARYSGHSFGVPRGCVQPAQEE